MNRSPPHPPPPTGLGQPIGGTRQQRNEALPREVPTVDPLDGDAVAPFRVPLPGLWVSPTVCATTHTPQKEEEEEEVWCG